MSDLIAGSRTGTDAVTNPMTNPATSRVPSAATGSPTIEQDLIARATEMNVGVGVMRIDNGEDMQRWFDQHMASVRQGLWSLLPSGPYPLDILRSSWDSDTNVMARGVQLKIIYQADAVRTPPMMQYVSDLASVGAEIRILRRASHRIMIFDRRAVFIATQPDTLDLPYLLVSEPALVRNFCNQFANNWRVAHSIGITAEDVLDFERVHEILRVLASGATDEAAARQLGVSDRTIRRRVAAVMDLLGATSRFEAGVKAVEAGWL